MSERAFKSELDGIAAAFKERLRRPKARVPTLGMIEIVARELIIVALKTGKFSRNEAAAFEFGDDRTVWFDSWPIGEWVSRSEMFGGEPNDADIVLLRLFDPNVRESLQWWVQTDDRLAYEALENSRRAQRRTVAQIERDQVEGPLARYLEGLGHIIKRQVKCSAGRIDILDFTANEIIECKAEGFASDITQAVLQLRRYADYFEGAKLAVAVPRLRSDADWLAETLHHVNIRIIEVEQLLRGGNQ